MPTFHAPKPDHAPDLASGEPSACPLYFAPRQEEGTQLALCGAPARPCHRHALHAQLSHDGASGTPAGALL